GSVCTTLLFLFSAAMTHPITPSFPTRRSSDLAFDLGVNFFDTADIYNKGEAEKALAKAIKDLRREDLFIATKCFWPMSDAPNDQDRKSTRLNSSHVKISHAVFCLKKKTPKRQR